MSKGTFEYQTHVRFEHCDPAGIVFYPRYFGMLAEAVSAWMTAATGWDERHLHAVRGECVHPARVRCSFRRPSRLGDHLALRLDFYAAGDDTLRVPFTVHCEEETRLTGELALDYLALDPAPHTIALPPELREALTRTLTPTLSRGAGEGARERGTGAASCVGCVERQRNAPSP